jgi:hypothetical protein
MEMFAQVKPWSPGTDPLEWPLDGTRSIRLHIESFKLTWTAEEKKEHHRFGTAFTNPQPVFFCRHQLGEVQAKKTGATYLEHLTAAQS